MKRFFVFCLSGLMALSAFGASYKNNTYQKLAREFTAKAERALDAGEYVLAEEYAAKAKENADLSDAYIRKMLAREFAEKEIKLAQNRINYVKSINGERNFPIAVEAGDKLFAQATGSFDAENYEAASDYARQVIDVLAEVYEITPLPKYYVVRPWATDKDCFWNISGRPYVYNNPFLWENLYEKNKKSLPRPNDPNLILPGMKMEIPSISGEYRDGTYSPDVKYEPYGSR